MHTVAESHSNPVKCYILDFSNKSKGKFGPRKNKGRALIRSNSVN